jgi:hypothetical protein
MNGTTSRSRTGGKNGGNLHHPNKKKNKKTATVRAAKSEKLSLGDNCMTKSKPALIGIRQLTPSKHKSVGFMTFSSNLWSFVAFCFFVWFRLSGNERMRG